MTEAFENSLRIALEKINKPEWLQPLSILTSHFDGMPDYDVQFTDELLNLVWSLQTAVESDPTIPLDILMSIRLSKLDAWTIRALNRAEDNQHVHWNPLTTAFNEFRNDTTEVLQKPSAYPTEDIIKRWSKDNLR